MSVDTIFNTDIFVFEQLLLCAYLFSNEIG